MTYYVTKQEKRERQISLIFMLLFVIFIIPSCTYVQSSSGVLSGKDGLGLVGEWRFYQRTETVNTIIVPGVIRFDEEKCVSEQVCELAGEVSFPGVIETNSHLFTGFSMPRRGGFYLTYGRPGKETVTIVVRKFIGEDAYGGVFLEETAWSQGSLGPDSELLKELGTGKVTAAGRMSMWR